ncbi:(d)CMP kinase [Actinopolymorpha alba]|uniref:(d)CMP kinase n=1 Tax=Actinopolymorpha alba TaxID=533267 RepID=UPI00036745A8|nr:(d)CMP kinase [Actinopolymorpha alba]
MERADKAGLDRIVVAIDGPSGSGKSSASRGVARRLGLRYLDTGAMYRAITWWMLRAGVPVDDADEVAARSGAPGLEIGTDPDAPTVAVDGVDVSGPIRSREVTNAVSAVAAVPAVRQRLIMLQRAEIDAGGIVVEGRDIGTTVAPNADVKVYLTAHAEERARRRAAEGLAGAKVEVNLAQQEMARRDQLDSGRATSPLAQAADAVVLDTTELNLEQVIDRICALADERVGASGAC